MTEPHIIEIDRIVLRGLDLPPHRAERIRALVEVELERRLDGGFLDGLAGGERSRLEAGRLRLVETQSEGQLAARVAGKIVQALKNGGR
jgi:hypothetical protein